MHKKTALLILKNVPISLEFFVLLEFSISFTFIHLSHKKKKKSKIKTFVTDSQPGYDFRMLIKFWLIVARDRSGKKFHKKNLKRLLISSFNQLSVPIRSK